MGAEQVGGIYYEVDLDTAKMVAAQRNVDKAVASVNTSLTSVSKATKTHIAALELQSAVSREAARSGDALAYSFGKQATSAKQLAFATRTLPAQFTDIFTQLAAGQSPMQVFIQQGGQIKDVFGGVGPALAAVGRYLVGLLNPITAVAAVLGALGIGFFKGRQESQEFTRSIVLSGNASGVTADQLNRLAAGLDAINGVTRGKAAEALTLLVDAGVQGSSALGKFAQAAILLEKAGGPAVNETARAFAALAKDPLAASLKLNEATNFLTLSVYKQVKALQDAGKFTEAAALAQNAYADAVLRRTPEITENIGYIERAARGVMNAAKEMWDAILNVGREQTTDERLKEVRTQIKALEDEIEARKGQRSFTPALDKTNQAEIAGLQAKVGILKEEVKLIAAKRTQAAALADEQAKQAAAVKAQAEADKKPKSNFDAVAYIVGLQERLTDAYIKIDLIETEELRKNDERLKTREISQKTHEAAKLLIIANAGKARADLQDKELQAVADREERLRQKIDEIEKKEASDRDKGRQLARDTIVENDPIAKLQAELEAKSALLLAAAQKDQDQAALYAEARVRLEQDTYNKIREIVTQQKEDEAKKNAAVLTGYTSLFGSLADITKAFAGEQSSTYRAMFAVSKAFALAEAIVNIQAALTKAANNPWPTNLAAMATVASATAGIVSTIQGAQFAGGRQYGGPVSAGSLYRVNEAGRPEMFTAANGAQYMMPTANGRVTPAESGAGGTTVIEVRIINQMPGATVSQRTGSDGLVEIVIGEVARQFAENDGRIWNAARSATNIQGRMG